MYPLSATTCGGGKAVARVRRGIYAVGMETLTDTARKTVADYDMLPEGAVVLAMVSGGADSVAMLRLLAEGSLASVAGLSVLHVNHLLRGEDADADEAFVRSLCEQLGVSFTAVRYDVGAFAEAEGLNLEDAGRRVRHRFAAEVLDERCSASGVRPEAGRIALAHTFDDRLETFLARLVSGAGSGGLRSIAPVRGRIVRPLIAARRAEVRAYLRERGQVWREDATNADVTRERAWVRHELLPLIESRNAAFDEVTARTLEILGEEDDLLSEMATAFARDFVERDGDAVVFVRDRMRTLTRPMARRTVREALLSAFPEASRLEFEHTEALVDGMAQDSFARDLPFGLRATTEYGRLRISRRRESPPSLAPGLLGLPSILDLGAAGALEARETGAEGIAMGVDTVAIDADRVSWPLVVDSPRTGDRLRPFGMQGTKKVSDLLIDAKVPKRCRSVVPVVRDGERVVWVAGVRLAEEVRVGPETVRVAQLVWRRPDERCE